MIRLVRFGVPLTGLLALAGCATAPVAPLGVAQRAAAVPPMPVAPAGLPTSLNVPATDADGTYRTINHGLTADETSWHVRSALNVAALSCRGPEAAGITPAYNAMLKRQAKPLATTLKAVEKGWRATRGKAWQAEHDAHMTRLYNYFAMPAAQPAFCAAATALAAESQAIAKADFAAFAQGALPRLEAPFTDVFRAYDGYRRDLAAWQARYGTPALAMTTAPRLAYADMGTLLRWDARETPIRTAMR